MQLSEHDLRQLDDHRLLALPLAGLQTLSLKLLHDLKEVCDRLNQGPDNSSRPPSSQVPWQKASTEVQTDSDEEDETEPERAGEGEASDPDTDSAAQAGKEPDKNPPPKPKPGKPGKREGAPGYGRSVELPVNATEVHRPDACALCEKAFPSHAPERGYTQYP